MWPAAYFSSRKRGSTLREKKDPMRRLPPLAPKWRAPKSAIRAGLTLVLTFIIAPVPLLADGTSPWESAVNVLQAAFTGPIARGLSLVAIVVGGLMFAFGE